MQQRLWAQEAGLLPDRSGYLPSVSSNLFQPLSAESQRDFASGSGGELRPRRRGGLPKMCATHSSAVLACNVFDYWRARDLTIVERALGLPAAIATMRFEAQFPTGLDGEPPNLDVAFRLADDTVVAVESKFTEPFRAKAFTPFKSKYFHDDQPLWKSRGLPRSAALVLGLQRGEVQCKHLDAPQLLKHALGLQTQHPGRFSLIYVYMDVAGTPGLTHREEVTAFGDAIAEDFPFMALSYARLIASLRSFADSAHDAYFEYLRARYGLVAPAEPQSTPTA